MLKKILVFLQEPNNRVLRGALLFGCIISFVVRNLCLGVYQLCSENIRLRLLVVLE